MSLRPQSVQQFPDRCKSLLELVERVVNGDSSIPTEEWQTKFADVNVLCSAISGNGGKMLYDETKQFLEDHVQKLYTSISSCGDENLLRLYRQYWQKYKTGSSHLDGFYGYLNTTFVKTRVIGKADFIYGNICTTEQLLYIGELALHIWRQIVIEPLKESLVKLLLEEINTDRCGGNVNEDIIQAVIHSLVDVESYKQLDRRMELYEVLFETPFLKATGEYYRLEAPKLLNLDRLQYVTNVKSRLEDEARRVRKFLHPHSYDKVNRECQQRMVVDHLAVLSDECMDMIITEKKQDLKHMYILLSQIENGTNTLIEKTEMHIKQLGHNVMEQLTDNSTIPTQFVEAILEVYCKYTDLIKDVFNADKRFTEALDRAIRAATNMKHGPKAVCKAPEWLATYCNKLLKKSTKGMLETEIDNRLSRSITILKYLDDLDIFEQHYRKMLAKRLLHGLSQSMDAEEAMISRLKQSCGHTFTHKMYRMLIDVRISSDLNQTFNETGCDLSLNFSIHVLEADAWPISQSLPTFAIPQQLEKSISQFEMFYSEQHSARRLTWIHTVCTAELKLLYLQKPYFVDMSTFQMAVLLPYESQDTLTVKELQATTQLPEKALLKQIQSLVYSTILLAGSGDSTNENTSFSLNMDYSNKRTKFKITAAVYKETQQDVEKMHQQLDKGRSLYLQAIIVRIIKSRKHLKHNILLEEVITQSRSRFIPSVVMIKKCIEQLIHKEYMKRNQHNKDEYNYIA